MAESKSGSFIVNNNTGSFTVNVDADQLTDGQKTMSVQIRRDSVRGQVIGNLSAPITINDTSFTPAGTIVSQGCVPGTYTYRVTKANGNGGTYNEDTPNSVTCGYVAPANPSYSFTRSVNNANEGSSFNITFNTNQSGSFPYTITGVSSADIGGASLSGSVSNGQVLTFNVTADTTTEGTETFAISLNNGQANTTVTINDTSISVTPNVITRTVNWSPSNGSLGLFIANRNFTGWMGDVTKSNLQVSSSERNSIVYDSLMRQKISELISYVQSQFGATISESSIDAELNAGIDSFNSIINDALGNNTNVIYLLTATPKQTNQTSFTNGGKIYTRTTLKYSAVDFGFANVLDVNISSDDITTALVNSLNNNGIPVTSAERTQIKNIIIVIMQLLVNLLNSVNDPVNLYDYTEQPV